MYTTVNKSEFIDDLVALGFSVDGAEALFDWYIDLEGETGKEIEYTPMSIAAYWNEYTEDELKEQYNKTPRNLANYTSVICLKNDRYVVADC